MESSRSSIPRRAGCELRAKRAAARIGSSACGSPPTGTRRPPAWRTRSARRRIDAAARYFRRGAHSPASTPRCLIHRAGSNLGTVVGAHVRIAVAACASGAPSRRVRVHGDRGAAGSRALRRWRAMPRGPRASPRSRRAPGPACFLPTAVVLARLAGARSSARSGLAPIGERCENLEQAMARMAHGPGSGTSLGPGAPRR